MPTALSRQQNSQLEAVGLHNKKLPGSVSLNASSKDAFEESDDDKMMHFGNPFQLPLTSSSFSSHQQQQQQEEEGARRYSMAVDRPSVYQNHQQNEAKHAHHLSAPASPSLLYKSLLLHHQNHQQQLYIQSPNYAFDSISVSSTESDSAVKNLLHNSPSRPSPLSTTAVSHNNNSNTTSTATTRSTAAARIEMDKSVLDSPTTATSITNSTTTSALSVTPSPTTHHTPFVGGVLSYAKWNIIDASSVDMSRASKLMMGALDPLDKTKFIIDTNRLPPSEIKRQEIFHELYVTEIEYARDLQLVLDVFVTGIKLRRLIPLTDMNTVFGNIDALAKLHLGLLMRMKELKRKGCGVAKGVGILFLKMVS